jgi:serine/threonine protein kinase
MTENLTRTAVDLEELIGELAEHYAQRLRAGEHPNVEEYTREHPEAADAIRQILPALEIMASVAKDEEPSFIDLSVVRGSPDPVVHGSHDPAHPASNIRHPASSTCLLGDFRILREIGRGGMGVVYEAEQLSLGRRVALKVLPFAAMLDHQQLKRFKNEARTAATLDHPNIVAIYSVGCERGVHYYAMQLIEGQSLAQVIEQLRAGSKERGAGSKPTKLHTGYLLGGSQLLADESEIRYPQSEIDTAPIAAVPTLHAPGSSLPAYSSRDYFRTVAQLGIQAAEALDHAHENGILHRDIKPANLMVDDTGKLWITDFGLARMEADAGITMTGDVLGTLRYMSPEQALAKRAVLDHRSDIYSLGITLYELLTLQPAFTGDGRQELLRSIAFDEPRRPRQLNPHIPQDLETVVLKAMEKEPTDRYTTAKELASDMKAFLEHRPITARKTSLVLRARKWLRRHRPAVVGSTAALLLALVVGTVVSTLAYQRQRDLKQTAQQHLELARESVDEMLTRIASTWVPDSTATSEIQRQFLERALEIYQRLADNPPDGNPRGADAALAHERIADIQHHLGHFADATDSIRTAVDICQELAAQRGASAANSEQLVRCYRKLSTDLHKQSQIAEALDATDRGLAGHHLGDGRAESAEQNVPVPFAASRPLRWELARLLYGRAELLVAHRRLTDASAAAEQVDTIVSGLLRKPGNDSIDDKLLHAQLADLQTTILRRQNQFEAAANIARPAVVNINRMRSQYPDSKGFLEVGADLHENWGEVLLAQGEVQKAVHQFRESLALRRQRLGGRNPTQLNYALMFDHSQQVTWRHIEALVITEYGNTQLRLAAALNAVGRPYEAECMLGEAAFNAEDDSHPDILAFWVQHANAAAAVAEHLGKSKSPEAEHYFQLAAALWNEIRAAFPQAVQFQSGLHGDTCDWDWFQTAHPDHASQQGTRKTLKLDSRNTAFWNHMLGRAWFQNEAWDDAVNYFTKSAELRTTDQAHDWLHLAMAYHHLGQHEKAKTEYDRTVTQMKEAAAPDAELESLRRTTARLLAEDNAAESN